MFLKRINIVQKLVKERKNDSESDNIILPKVHRILDEVSENRLRIVKNMTGANMAATGSLQFDLLDSDRIFHLRHIKKICIDYRLRFLDAKYFKGEIPEEAISKISSLEREHCIEIKNFKVIAPSKLFKLKDKDDPLLFFPMGNDYFYLVHQWGNDLHPLRKLIMWPFRNIVNLIVLVAIISYLVTSLVPKGLFSRTDSSAEFWIIFFFMFKSIAAVVIFYGFALGKNFSPEIWRSKYFNA